MTLEQSGNVGEFADAMLEVARISGEIGNRISPGFTVLCDMGGTLVNTDYANYLSYRRAIEEIARSKHHISFDPMHKFNREGLKNVAVSRFNGVLYAIDLSRGAACKWNVK